MHPHPTTMLCVATAQNVINLIPAIQLGIEQIIWLETDFALRKKWATKAEYFCKARKISVLDSIYISDAENAKIEKIVYKIEAAIIISDEGIAFNFGGGQKAQSTAVWQVFSNRKNKDDIACYMDQTSGNIEIYCWDEDVMKSKEIPIKSNISIEEYFGIFGFQVMNQGKLTYSNSMQYEKIEVEDYTIYPSFREYVSLCFKATKDLKDERYTIEEIKEKYFKGESKKLKSVLEKKIFDLVDGNRVLKTAFKNGNSLYDTIFKALRDEFLPLDFSSIELYSFEKSLQDKLHITALESNSLNLKKITKTPKFGDYFEDLLCQRVVEILSANKTKVIEARANVRLDGAELDIVLMLSSGKLVVLDAKSDAFSKKDEDARNYNLLQASGVYSDFIPVYLFYPEDMDKNYSNKSVITKIKSSSHSSSKYYTYNTKTENENIVISEVSCRLNPIYEIVNLLK